MACGLALLLSACATTQRIGLDPLAKQKLGHVKVISEVPQDEIMVRADISTGGTAIAGGMVGFLMDTQILEGRQITLQDAIEPLYAAVDDHDFRTRLNQAMSAALANDTSLNFATVETSSMLTMPAQAVIYLNTLPKNQGLLRLQTSYTLTREFKHLQVTMHATIATKGSETPSYKNTLVYLSAPVGKDNADALKSWSADGGALYRRAADEAVQQILAMLKLDLAVGASDPANLPQAKMPVVIGMPLLPETATLLQPQQGRAIVRVASGQLYSITQ